MGVFITPAAQSWNPAIEAAKDQFASAAQWQNYIPIYAYWSSATCEGYMENDSGVDVSNQEALDNFFISATNGLLLQTDKYHISGAVAPYTVKSFYEKDLASGDRVHSPGAIGTFGPLKDRGYYDSGGLIAATGGTGQPASLPVDFLYSPFVEPALLTEQFEIEPVLNAGFLPGFRPGDLDQYIIPHPDRYSTIRVMSIDKEVIYATTNFMLESYTKATKESFKIIESTLGNTLQLNKEKYKLFTLKIGLVDAATPFDWLRNWEEKWEKYMRASVLAQNRWRWYILYGSHLIGGYPLQYSLSANAKDEPYSSINVDIFVTDDVRLPDMKRMASEDGLTYFRWSGTVYNQDTTQYENVIPEYPTSARKAETPEDASYESES